MTSDFFMSKEAQILRWVKLEKSFYDPDFEPLWQFGDDVALNNYIRYANKVYQACKPFIPESDFETERFDAEIPEKVVMQVIYSLRHARVMIPQGFIPKLLVDNPYMKTHEDILVRVFMFNMFSRNLAEYLIFQLEAAHALGYNQRNPAKYDDKPFVNGVNNQVERDLSRLPILPSVAIVGGLGIAKHFIKPEHNDDLPSLTLLAGTW